MNGIRWKAAFRGGEVRVGDVMLGRCIERDNELGKSLIELIFLTSKGHFPYFKKSIFLLKIF